MADSLSAGSLSASQGGFSPDPEASRSSQGQAAPNVRAASVQSARLAIDHQIEQFDRVEISGAFSASGGAAGQSGEGGLTFNTDGTYSISASHYRRESISIQAEVTSAGIIEAEGTEDGLRTLLNDVRDAFRSILQELRDSLVKQADAPEATRLTLPGISDGALSGGGEVGVGALGAGDRQRLHGYLDLLRQFAGKFGDNPALAKAIDELEKYLEVGDTTGGATGGNGASAASVQSVQSVSISIDIEITEVTQLNVQFGGQQVQAADPLVVDLDGDGIELTSVENGVNFDITGDGVAEQTAFPTGGDGLVVFDRNGNGIIDSGRELFGDQHGAANGFAELAKFDDNSDGQINSADPIYDQLRVFVDRNLDGASQQDELMSLNSAGIRSLLLSYNQHSGAVNGNAVPQVGGYVNGAGITQTAADVMLNYLA